MDMDQFDSAEKSYAKALEIDPSVRRSKSFKEPRGYKKRPTLGHKTHNNAGPQCLNLGSKHLQVPRWEALAGPTLGQQTSLALTIA
ncbi:hypothetical protein RJ641_015015 [Dillenia turbinata]|uniref:Uncharacterized protein n=1 Tax=Dillenia turbinata TaxID=194707 RepID=A0AAN8V285_9MAGN